MGDGERSCDHGPEMLYRHTWTSFLDVFFYAGCLSRVRGSMALETLSSKLSGQAIKKHLLYWNEVQIFS